jgi:hypothetical protein
MPIGAHQSAAPGSTVWLTPPAIIDALGGWQSFDLDPCAAPEPRPWQTAQHMNARTDANGLAIRWTGRVWLNPPYTSAELAAGLGAWRTTITAPRCYSRAPKRTPSAAISGNGRAGCCSSMAACTFTTRTGGALKPTPARLACSRLWFRRIWTVSPQASSAGAFMPLRFARFVAIAGLDQSWAVAMRAWIGRQRGPVSVSDAYRYFARHPKAAGNPNWRAKVRQKLAQVGERIERDRYVAAAA